MENTGSQCAEAAPRHHLPLSRVSSLTLSVLEGVPPRRSQLVNRFFRVFEKWNWKSAVRLCETQDLTHLPGFDAFTPWNPKAAPRAHPPDV